MKNTLRTLLKGKLTPSEVALVYNSYDVIGDIAVIRVPDQMAHQSGTIAEALTLQHKHVKSIWRQTGPVSGDLRLRELEWVSGERRTETVHKEYGCLFKVDVKDCYFSPRLGFERMRIASLAKENEVIVNMFAGVGCYSIVIVRHSNVLKTFSIDVNPVAIKYLRENILLNKVVGKVIAVEGDARKIIDAKMKDTGDRILMPLPEKAHEYIDCAIAAIKPPVGWIHYYQFEHATKRKSPVEKVEEELSRKLQRQNVDFEIRLGRLVRQTGPNWYQVAIDVRVQK